MGQENSKQAYACSLRELLQTGGAGFSDSVLEDFLAEVDSCCPWFPQEGTLNKKSWEMVGEVLRTTRADSNTLCLWKLVKDAIDNKIDKETSQALATAQAQLEEFQELPSKSPCTKRGTLNPKSGKCRPSTPSPAQIKEIGDSDNKSELEEGADLKKGGSKYHKEWPLYAPSAPPMVLDAAEAAQMDMKVHKLEMEIKLQKLTNELQELKCLSGAKRSDDSEMRQSPLERAVNQAHRDGQDTSDVLAFPVADLIDQQNRRTRQYQPLEFKVIKQLKSAVSQYGPDCPFTQALLDTVVEANLMPQDWKTLCKATLSGGDYLLWSSEWRDASKKTAMMNAQAGNADWDFNMLLGEGQYEGNANQVELPAGVYAQVAMAAHCAWNQLPTKGDLSGNLSSIKQGPDELFQEFVDRLLKAAGRIFGDPQSGIPFVTQLADIS
uniref:LOW QUALITY PROTEIN: endogenous retrovirus group K member 10 Gag polyprotein-like n=1 Tax=Arvicanthis niloticus TaxID=61156 RepID=UPI00402B82DD